MKQKTKPAKPSFVHSILEEPQCQKEEDTVRYNLLDDTYYTLASNKRAAEKEPDLSTVLANLSNETHLGSLKSYLEALDSQKPLDKPLSEPKLLRLQRKQTYTSLCKDVKKWLPQVRQNASVEQLRFGSLSHELKDTTSSLSAHFKPIESFEEELCRAVKASGVEANRETSRELAPVAEPIKDAARYQRLAKLRSLLFHQHRKAKRIGKIKSKMWRKIYRKSEIQEREKLLNQLEEENPEVAQEIRRKFEEKRASMRMLKHQQARRKWAEVALRFGGQDMQKVVSHEIQKERDDKDALDRIVRCRPENVTDATDSSQDDEDDITESGQRNTPHNKQASVRSILNKAKSLIAKAADSSSDDGSERDEGGLLSMPFMQRAITKKRRENQQLKEETLQQFRQLEGDLEKDSESDDSGEIEEKGAGSYEKKRLPRIPEALLEESRKRTKLTAGAKCIQVAILSSRITPKMFRDEIQVKKDVTTPMEAMVPKTDAVQAIQSLLESTVDAGVLATNAEQEALIQEAFVMDSSIAEDFSKHIEQEEAQDAEQDNSKQQDTKFLTGWGSWTGTGIKPRKVRDATVVKKEQNRNNLTGRIYINRRLDRKLAPYFVKSLPFPYKSKDQFEMFQKHPLGPEWNTLHVHERLIVPKVHVRPGTIIMPLEHAKYLPNDMVDSLLDAWNEKSSNRRVEKARL